MRRINYIVAISALTLSGVMVNAGSIQDFNFAYHNATQGYIDGIAEPITIQHSKFIIGASININLADANRQGAESSAGLFGYGLELGYLWNFYSGNYVGLIAGWNQTNPTTFSYQSGGQVTSSLQMPELKIDYRYMFNNGFGIGTNAGISYVFGSNTASGNDALTNNSYGEFMPTLGLQLSQEIAANVTITASYAYYFGSESNNAYESGNIPSQNQFKFGIQYAF